MLRFQGLGLGHLGGQYSAYYRHQFTTRLVFSGLTGGAGAGLVETAGGIKEGWGSSRREELAGGAEGSEGIGKC